MSSTSSILGHRHGNSHGSVSHLELVNRGQLYILSVKRNLFVCISPLFGCCPLLGISPLLSLGLLLQYRPSLCLCCCLLLSCAFSSCFLSGDSTSLGLCLLLLFSLGLLFLGSFHSLPLGIGQSLFLGFSSELLLPHLFGFFGLSSLLCSENSGSLFGGSSSLSSNLACTLLGSSLLCGSSTSSCCCSSFLCGLVCSVSLPEHKSAPGGGKPAYLLLAGSSSSPCSEDTLMSGMSTGSSGFYSCLALSNCSSVSEHFISAKDKHPPMGGTFPQHGLSPSMGSTLCPCSSHSL